MFCLTGATVPGALGQTLPSKTKKYFYKLFGNKLKVYPVKLDCGVIIILGVFIGEFYSIMKLLHPRINYFASFEAKFFCVESLQNMLPTHFRFAIYASRTAAEQKFEELFN